ncbi:hypothetical protein [Streptomyces lasiicapitis]|uniref:hypothetical protein n=1 Tax=Streptomyces lasiicapitis TaxID=1923961 RepID=UPI0033334308
MRPRAIAFAATCALMLLIATPGSASAVPGTLHYKYVDSNGETKNRRMDDPESKYCHNLSETNPDVTAERPAHTPSNYTEEKAYLYTEEDCGGTEYVLRADTGEAGADLKFRSVLFNV